MLLLGFAIAAFYQAYLISGFSEIAGPGVFPMLAAATMILSGVAILRATLAKASAGGAQVSVAARFGREITPLKLAVVLALIAAYAAAMPGLGFVVSSGGFLFAMIAYLWRRGMVVSLALSAGCLALIYIIFRVLFQVVLPQGTLWQ